MVKPEQYFYVENGVTFKSIKDLALNLDKLPEEIFEGHVNEHKNDFANWIEGVFKNKTLAAQLKQVDDLKDFQIILLKSLVKIKRIKKFKCKTCGKTYDTKVGLSVHKTITHKKKG